MKLKLNYLLILTFFALFSLNSCQNEILEVTDTNEETLIAPNSTLADLMESAVTNDGGVDDILDNSNCFNVDLPVTIIVNGITITINTREDLALIEEIINQLEDDEDILEFIFPITIILSDYEEIVIENQQQFEALIDTCTEDETDVIDCIDFQYPISFSIYNTAFQIIDTVVIESDEQLYEFLERLQDESDQVVLASLNFPVTMIYANGNTVTVNNNYELEEVLNDAREDCSEEEACREEVVNAHLKECYWNVVAYNESNDFNDYDLYFKEDGLFKVIFEGNVITTGRWQTTTTDNGVVVTISELSEYQELFEGDWLIVECEDDYFKLIREESANSDVTRISIEKECEDDFECTALDIRLFLSECQWFAGSDLFDNVPVGEFHFLDDNVLVVVNTETGNEYTGIWEVELTDEAITLLIDLPAPYDAISKRWKITECAEHRIKMIADDNYLVFERNCSNQSCTEEELDSYLMEFNCYWVAVAVNGSNAFDDFAIQFNENQDLLIEGGGANFFGTWSTAGNPANGVFLTIAQLENNFSVFNGQWLVLECGPERIVLVDGNNEIVIERECP
ncbi:MAG: hypothetical protein R2785_01550 [Flavobacteriaceae bacterium]